MAVKKPTSGSSNDLPEIPADLSPLERIEAEYKLELIIEMRAKREQKAEALDELIRQQKRRVEDMRKDQEARTKRQNVCRHKKGGRNNNFAKGNSADASINLNIYPNGIHVLFCTRCGAERIRPERKLSKSDPERYAVLQKAWNEWAELSTDNSASGSQIFLRESAA